MRRVGAPTRPIGAPRQPEIPPADGLPGGPPRGGETAAGEAPEDILSYGGSHQDQLQGLLRVLAT